MDSRDELKDCLICLAAAVLVGVLTLWACSCDATPETVTTERAAGQPLDAVSYDAPAWMPGCEACMRVTDRQTGRSWWLLEMRGSEYVVLPGGER